MAVVWRNEFIVHGGGTDEGEASDRTYFYDLDARRWVARELAGQPALARRDHAAALVGERLFLFGGASAAGTELMRTMPVLHLRSRVWSRPAVYGRFPPAVSGHSLTAVGSRLVLLGGRIGQLSALPDVYLFDTDAMAWTRRRAGDAREGALVKGRCRRSARRRRASGCTTWRWRIPAARRPTARRARPASSSLAAACSARRARCRTTSSGSSDSPTIRLGAASAGSGR